MASAGGIRAGKAFVELYMKDKAIARGFKRIGVLARKMGNQFKAAGRKIFMVGAALSLVLGIATRTFIPFSDQMQVVRAVTGATAEEFDKLNERAKKLGRTTSFTASQVAAGMASLGRAGFSNDEILDSIDAVLNLARGTATELERSGEIVSNTMRAFRLEAKNTTYVTDLMTKTANSSAQVLEDLGESLKYVAPFAYDAGESLKDTLASLATLANIGIKGSMAGTALARAYKNLSKSNISDFMKSLGIETKDANGNLRKMSDILFDLGQRTKSMGTADKLAVFDKIFGRGAVAASGLSSGGTLKNFQKILNSVNGTAAKTAEIMDSGLGGVWRRFASAVEGVALSIGETLEPVLTRYGNKAAEIANKITDWINQNKGLIITIAKTAVVLLGVGAALMVVGTALVVLGMSAHGLGALITLGTTIFGIVKTSITAIIALGAALKALSLSSIPAMLGAILNPATLTAGAIVFVGAVLMKTTGAWANMKKVASDAISTVKADFSKAYGEIVAALKAGELGAAWKIICTTLNLEWTRLWNACKDYWSIFKNFIKGGYNLLTKDIVSVFLKTTYTIKNAWSALGYFFSRFWLKIKAGAINSWRTALRTMNLSTEQNINIKAETDKLDKKYKEDSKKAETKHNEDLKANEALYKYQQEQNRTDLNNNLKESSDSLRKAVGEFSKAVKEAKEAARKATAAKTAAARSEYSKTKNSNKPSVWDNARAQLLKTSVSGSFSGMVAANNGGFVKRLQEKIVDITEDIKESTGEIARNTREGGPRFAQ